MKPIVLFADDQIPSTDEANTRTKEEIIRVFGRDPGFDEDHRWFEGLMERLRRLDKFEVIDVKSFEEATKTVEDTGKFDIAVIDLSWTGDPDLPEDRKKNVGLELIQLIENQNQRSNRYVPIIAFSQNFLRERMHGSEMSEEDRTKEEVERFELVTSVLEAGALPVQKIYKPIGHKMLSAAIKHLLKLRPVTGNDRSFRIANKHYEELWRQLKFQSIVFNFVLVLSFIFAIAAAVGALVFQYELEDFTPVLNFLGSGGIVFFAYRAWRSASKDLQYELKSLLSNTADNHKAGE